jgi:hypothetical protein
MIMNQSRRITLEDRTGMIARRGLIFLALVLCGLVAFGERDADALTLISDGRLTLPEFARKSGQDPNLVEARYAATGMIICSGIFSTAQLTVRNDVVTTAAHAFFDPDGNPRGDLSTCTFAIDIGGIPNTVPLDVASLRVGSRNPYSVSPVHDWAVVRLKERVPEARPYGLGTTEDGAEIVMLAHRHSGWVHDGLKAIEACAIRSTEHVDPLSARELDIDCSAGGGASGSAIMLPGAAGAMVGIYVGWRSTHPDSPGLFSQANMNFGVAVEGPFRDAILATTNGSEPTPIDANPTETAQVPVNSDIGEGRASLP